MSHTERLGTVGYGVGAMQSGITLMATCTPFDAIPPTLWEGFKKALMQSAADWGLTVRLSEHPSIQEGKLEFHRQVRINNDAAERLARVKAGG